MTGTFRHEATAVMDVVVEGTAEPIGTTPNHPFWSEDRQEYVRADSLKIGERLLGQSGPVRVKSLSPRGSPEPVFNIEVQCDHNYRVADAAVLVHNGNSKVCTNSKFREGWDRAFRKRQSAPMRPYGGPGGGHHVPAKKAFEGANGFDENKALAIPNDAMKSLDVRHPLITGAQARLYREYSKTGKSLTWDAIENIETKALIAGGMDAGMAAATAQRGVQALKNAGVPGPTRIPWGGLNP